jgi:GT2 family glycosyltransferase
MNSRRNLPLISVVIPNHNGAGYLEPCLRSLQAQTYENMEIVVVDNASQDLSAEIVQRLAPGAVLLRENRNLGFAGGVNAGIRSSRGEWVAVLNNDTEVAADWLAECTNAIQNHPEAAYFACKILDFSDRSRIYSAGDCFLRMGIGYRRGQEQKDRPDLNMECEIFSASGCAAVYRKQVLDDIGGFDERFFAYLEDVGLGLRLQAAGNRGYYIPGAKVYHHGAATSGGEFSPLAVHLRTRNSLLLLLKNMPILFLLRCMPMTAGAQLSWFLRAAAHRRLGSYLRGLCSAIRLTPAMLRDRAILSRRWQNSRHALWRKILQSESQARRDFSPAPVECNSVFLKWYFRLF